MLASSVISNRTVLMPFSRRVSSTLSLRAVAMTWNPREYYLLLLSFPCVESMDCLHHPFSSLRTSILEFGSKGIPDTAGCATRRWRINVITLYWGSSSASTGNSGQQIYPVMSTVFRLPCVSDMFAGRRVGEQSPRGELDICVTPVPSVQTVQARSFSQERRKRWIPVRHGRTIFAMSN